MTGLDVAGGRVRAVRIGAQCVEADQVVVAMGSFSAPLMKALGLRVPIYPVKGVSITMPRGGWNGAPRMPVIDDSKLFGLVPVGDRMRISGSAEIAGFDTVPAPARAAAIVANAGFTFPGLTELYRPESARIWAGLRPVTPAGTPMIGPTSLEGLWINAGHGHLGWTLACGSGRVMAALIDGRDPGVTPETRRALAAQHQGHRQAA